MEEKIKITEYLEKCLNFEENPENEGALVDVEKYLSQLTIREYIPLKEKEIILMRVLTQINKDYDVPGTAVFLEMAKVSIGLLSYCTNLENDLGTLAVIHHTYDIINQYGLYDAIYSRCSKDYEKLSEMIDNAMQASNIYRIVQTAALFDNESYDKWINAMTELKSTINSKNLKDLIAVTASNDPSSDELLKQLQETALEQVKKETKEELDKFKNAADFAEKTAKISQLESEEKESGEVSE